MEEALKALKEAQLKEERKKRTEILGERKPKTSRVPYNPNKKSVLLDGAMRKNMDLDAVISKPEKNELLELENAHFTNSTKLLELEEAHMIS